MFPAIPVVGAWATWSGVDYSVSKSPLANGVTIESTTGHTYDSLPVFVETPQGSVAICGDLFWWENDAESDKYAVDLVALKQSRAKVLAQAWAIIPGHGPKFFV